MSGYLAVALVASLDVDAGVLAWSVAVIGHTLVDVDAVVTVGTVTFRTLALKEEGNEISLSQIWLDDCESSEPRYFPAKLRLFLCEPLKNVLILFSFNLAAIKGFTSGALTALLIFSLNACLPRRKTNIHSP